MFLFKMNHCTQDSICILRSDVDPLLSKQSLLQSHTCYEIMF